MEIKSQIIFWLKKLTDFLKRKNSHAPFWGVFKLNEIMQNCKNSPFGLMGLFIFSVADFSLEFLIFVTNFALICESTVESHLFNVRESPLKSWTSFNDAASLKNGFTSPSTSPLTTSQMAVHFSLLIRKTFRNLSQKRSISCKSQGETAKNGKSQESRLFSNLKFAAHVWFISKTFIKVVTVGRGYSSIATS